MLPAVLCSVMQCGNFAHYPSPLERITHGTHASYRSEVTALFSGSRRRTAFWTCGCPPEYVTTPLSIHIKELEQQLGTLLFIRHSRSVTLTHAGKILMEESRRLLSSANQALARVEQIGRGEAGRVELA